MCPNLASLLSELGMPRVLWQGCILITPVWQPDMLVTEKLVGKTQLVCAEVE